MVCIILKRKKIERRKGEEEMLANFSYFLLKNNGHFFKTRNCIFLNINVKQERRNIFL